MKNNFVQFIKNTISTSIGHHLLVTTNKYLKK